MVEGNGVWRTAAKLRLLFLRRRLRASSPNGSLDPSKVNGCVLVLVQTIGKNLFLHFETPVGLHVLHLHFGMSGPVATSLVHQRGVFGERERERER